MPAGAGLERDVRLFQRAAAPRSRLVAVDSTGFARAPASPYYQPRAGHRHRARTWLKWSVAVWTDPLVLCGQIADWGPRGDYVEFRPLVAQTPARLRFTRLLADGGYASETNHHWLREDLGIESIIPPVAGRPARGLTWRPDRRQLRLAFPRKTYSGLQLNIRQTGARLCGMKPYSLDLRQKILTFPRI